MAISVTHATQATGADDPTKEINKGEWNAAHSLTGEVPVANGGTGLSTIADAAILVTNAADTITALTAGASQSVRRNAGNTAWEAYTPSSGGAALSGITAATAGNTIASGNNHSQIWNWALTSNSVNAFTFGETTAATNGTSTDSVPNQVIAKFSTVAASTASPLSVYVRGNFLMAASVSTRQLFMYQGTNAAPSYSFAFAGDSATGMWYDTNNGGIGFTYGGLQGCWMSGLGVRVKEGSNSTAGLAFLSDTNTGLFSPVADNMAVTTGGVEQLRWSAGVSQYSKGTADAVSYALNFRKSRGTVASPTVITTGDDLATISGYGYVGATGTYVEACQIKFDSTGTIANTTSGVGGIMRFGASVVGTVGITEVMRLQVATTTGGGWLSMDEADANPATTDLAADDAFSIYRKADKLVIAHNLAGVMNYLTIPLDGSTTTWTQGTGAP